MLRDISVIVALVFGLTTSHLAVWIFSKLKQGILICPDKMNEIEFYLAIAILAITVVALITHIIAVLRVEGVKDGKILQNKVKGS